MSQNEIDELRQRLKDAENRIREEQQQRQEEQRQREEAERLQEKEQRQREEAERQQEVAEQNLNLERLQTQNTTLPEFLDACHEHLFLGLTIQKDKKSSTKGDPA